MSQSKIPLSDDDLLIKQRRQSDQFTFDKTINLGHVISITIMLFGLISIISKINDMQTKVNMMWNDFAKTKGICCSVPTSYFMEPSWWDRFVPPVAAKELNR